MRQLPYSVMLLVLALGFSAPARADVFQDAAKGNLPAVRAYLDKGSNINAADKEGATPLHHAMASNQVTVVNLLLRRKANVNARKKDGVTPLHVAAAVGRVEVAKLLLAAGADRNAKDDRGRTPALLARSSRNAAVATVLRASAPAPPTTSKLKTVDVSNIVVKESHRLENAYGVRWAAGGEHLVFWRREGDGVCVYTADRRCQSIRALGEGMSLEDLSPDGKTVYLSHREQGVFAAALPGGRVRRVTATPLAGIRVLNGGKVATARAGVRFDPQYNLWMPDREKPLVFLDLTTGAVAPAGGPDWSAEMASWSSDGAWFFVQTKEGQFVGNSAGVVKPLDTKVRVVYNGPGMSYWLPDTHDLLGTKANGTITDLYRVSPDTGEATPLTTPAGPVRCPSDGTLQLSREGGWITHGSWGKVILIRLADGRQWEAKGQIEDAFSVSWLPGETGWCTADGVFRDAADPTTPVAGSLKVPFTPNAVSPDGTMMVYYPADAKGKLSLARVDGKQAHVLLSPCDGDTSVIRWDPNGSGLIVPGSPTRVLLLGRK